MKRMLSLLILASILFSIVSVPLVVEANDNVSRVSVPATFLSDAEPMQKNAC